MVSVEALERSFSERLRLNRQILDNKYWFLPYDDVGHENFMPVGRGVVSSITCGEWRSLSVCSNVAGHKDVIKNGVDYTDKVVVRHNHWWCNKSSCPRCFIRGWSVRGARSVEGRLIGAVKRGFGKVEHVVVSPPIVDRGLSESVMRKKCRDALVDRGVVGGCMIFHGYRIDKKRGVLVWSPHYHVLGFIKGGFDRCRDCVHLRGDCGVCDGFKGREVRGFAMDGYLVKVMRERNTVFGTAFYQLHHSTIRIGIKGFHVTTWFGCCSNKKFKGEKVEAKLVCPACGEALVKSIYFGERPIVKDIGHADYKSCYVDDAFNEDGSLRYVPVVGSRFG